MHLIVRCGECGRLHQLERSTLPEPPVVVPLLCHDCERPISATIDLAEITRALMPPAPHVISVVGTPVEQRMR